ncbi:MAG TPA: tetratricopeptide repeat protein [Bryobacteraceae bacterium]|nr:tetratricopeptide repeat protein [Bryobacteraceae bacterium]
MRSAALLLVSLGILQAADEPVTFNKQIAPIVFEYCAPCHRPGEAAPFSLLTYDEVKKHAHQIATVTKSRFMPPWLPESGGVKISGERKLTEQEILLLERWASEGAPEGRAEDLPTAPKFTEGWQLGAPDLVLTLPKAYSLPPEGSDTYRNFIFTFSLDGVHYIRALEIRPGNKRVVHHANLLIDRNRSSRWRDGRDGAPGFPGMDLQIEANVLDPESHLLFWKPGTVLTEEPTGMAWPLEKDNDLVLNMHLQPSGKAETIQPSLGLYFTTEKPKFRPILVQLENDRALDIPPGKHDFEVRDDFTLPVDADILAVYPHAHYLGRDIEGTATLPGGAKQTLIRIRHWDLNWQAVYNYEKPLFLPKGTTISMRWIYDNTTGKRVVAGDRSTDEMSHLWLQVLPRGPGDQRMLIQEAIARKRIARDPGDFTAHFNLGGLLQASGKSDAAIREVREAVRLRPKDAVALNTLGALLQLANQPSAAEASYRAAIQAQPEYPDAHFNLADLLLARDTGDEAILQLREVVKLAPDDAKAKSKLAEVLNERAHAAAQQGALTQATADFRDIVALKPDDSDACTNLGVALAMQRQFAEARELFERALRLNPQNAVAHRNLELVRQNEK